MSLAFLRGSHHRLSPDSPLLQPEAPDRIFSDPAQYAFCQRMRDLRELGFSADQIFSDNYYEDINKKPVHSVLPREEIEELLTPAGTVWFLGQSIELDVWEASRLCEAGTPWPLRAPCR